MKRKILLICSAAVILVMCIFAGCTNEQKNTAENSENSSQLVSNTEGSTDINSSASNENNSTA
uniref:hypothetical protein n=1 Tax=Eubacterium sp. TaxID=142586 RepID=UPI0040264091